MDTQFDSIDIAELKDFALGIGDLDKVSDPRHLSHESRRSVLRAGLLTPSTMQTQQSDASPQATALTNNPNRDSEARNVEHPRTGPTKQQVGRIRRDAATTTSLRPQSTKSLPFESYSALRLTASQPQLSSTVPDSHEARMAMAGFQSQGDTQPLSQGVQEEFANRIKEQQGMLTLSATGVQDRSHSYQPGETGHIDLLAGFEEPFANDSDVHTGQDEDLDPISQAADVRAELYPESKRFQEPKTPATAGRKRSRDGATISRENTTPRLPINPFAGQVGGFEGMMNASQAFKATQFTSPLPDQVMSDGFSDRPSPEMYIGPRPSTADLSSSPAKLPRSNTVRAVTEPQTTYVSIKESQAERERLLQLSAPPAPDESDDGFDSDGSELRRRRKQRRLEMEAKRLFDGITARPRPGSSGRGRGGLRGRGGQRAYMQRSSPRRQSGRIPAEAVLISDDPLAEGNVTEDETEHEEEHTASDTDSIDELAEDNKENVRIKRVQVPMTTSRANNGRTTRIASQPSPSRFRVRQSASPGSSMRAASETHDVQGVALTEAAGSPPKATQTVAIVDSQPSDRTSSRRSPKPAHHEMVLPQSSLEPRMVIPQSQPHPTAKADQPASRDKIELRAGTPGVPASSTNRSTSNGSSSTGPHEGVPATAKSRSGGTRPASVLSRKDTASTDQIASSPPESSKGQAGVVEGKSSAMTHGPNASRDGVLDAMGAKPREKPVSEAVTTANGEHFSQLQNDTIGLARSEEQVTQIRAPSTIPETISAVMQNEPQAASTASSEALRSTNASSKPSVKPQPSSVAQSNASTAFHTAATHMTVSSSKSRITQLQSENTSPSPKKLQSRTLAEITADPSPPDMIGDVDVDVNLLTNEDIEFQATMSGSGPVLPARKRRRGQGGRVLQVTASGSNVALPPGNVPANSSNAENIASSPPEPSAEQAIRKAPENSSTVRNGASSSPRPSVEQAVEKVSGDSDLLVTGAHTPSKNNDPQPSAVQTGSRKRGRPKKVIKNPVEPNEQLVNLREHNSAMVNKVLHIEVPKIRRNEGNDPASSQNGSVVAPNQVFAHFNGNCAGYFPATCIGIVGGEEPLYRVRFDDGMVDTINGYGIKRLELRPGDHVKLDRGGARKNAYVVERMQGRQQPLPTPDPETPSRRGLPTPSSTLNTPQTDIRGYASVVVSLRQAHSPSKGEQSMTVPIRDVYLTQTMWTSFKDRSYTHTPIRPQFASRLQTPSERPSNPSTPSSRARRIKGSGMTHSRSVPTSAAASAGIFDNMAFAVTNISDPALRASLRHQICSNGGRLLADGFDELFDIPSFGPASPSKRSSKKDTDRSFHLTEVGKQTGFTCLIADKHCRMAKYIQALALGIPCLASRWIQDCITKQQILPWLPYLLAAGESAFLGGAIRSRLLPSFPPETSNLTTMIDSRSKPLDGDSVLLIMEKGEEEKMKSHPLITHALGARKVSRAANLDAAAHAIEEAKANGEPWDWVYSHDKEDKAEKALFGRASLSKKRKRFSRATEDGGVQAGRGKTRVVGNEFVIQSLILGQLVE